MFFLNKKGSEMTLNVIIIAAIALIVLVVMLFIFSGKIKAFGQGTDSCTAKGGSCTAEGYSASCIKAGSCACPSSMQNTIYLQGTDCEKTATICCKQVY